VRRERPGEDRVPGRRDGRRADSVDDMDLLRHGAMPVLFGDIRAPSTLGSFLRSFTWAIWDDQLGRWVSAPRSRKRNTPPLPRTRAGHHRPAHRPPGQGPQPRRRPGPGRAGHRLAVPRGLHRLAVHLGPGRRAAPRPRSGRAGLRRLDRRPACAPALRYLPANAAWLALAAISCNLLRAAGALASLAYSNARGATIRRDLIDVAAPRPARSRPPHPAPARGLVSRARMDEPVHRNLRLGPSFGQP
jgi:hypothetical protein